MKQQSVKNSNQVDLPFYDKDANLSLERLRKFIGASRSQMVNILGNDERNDASSTVVAKRLRPLIHGIKLLLEIAGPKEIKRWLNEPLAEWEGISPMDELEKGNFEGVLHLIQRVRSGEGAY